MSKRYTPEQKAVALQAIIDTGSVDSAIQLAQVPRRTLFRWQCQWRREGKLPLRYGTVPSEKTSVPVPLPPNLWEDDPEFAEILQREAEQADDLLDDVLQQMMQSVRVLVGRLNTNFDQASPVSQMMALARLLDRILKLDARKPRLQKGKAHIIRYQYPDGAFHKRPPWYGGDDNDGDTKGMNLWTRQPLRNGSPFKED